MKKFNVPQAQNNVFKCSTFDKDPELTIPPSSLPALPLVSIHLFLLFSQQGKEDFLQILHRYMEVHGTVYYETQRPPEVPAFVKNHGILPQHELQQLLRKAKARAWREALSSMIVHGHSECTLVILRLVS